MSTNDYVKYMTQQLVRYMDTPKEERKVKKTNRKKERQPLFSRWFGVLPFAVMLLMKKRK
ncbi:MULTISPECIES: YqzE family protein [Bacillaceae]|uniref:YqzE family protein n=1 Tax=Bacillaceae TaxID=186817 RepID=UPI000C76B6D5|nr:MULTISPECIES: YqzE family protein [Bacillaceae]PLR68111.1 YqzE family protein [Bacillus sp. UMB0893]QNG61241.1 YqzE family protein [Bacillus sp. PAMC26568]